MKLKVAIWAFAVLAVTVGWLLLAPNGCGGSNATEGTDASSAMPSPLRPRG